MSTENANLPAFPFPPTFDSDGKVCESGDPGLTKREYFAALAMHGLLSNPSVLTAGIPVDEKIESAIIHADELLNQLDNSKQINP